MSVEEVELAWSNIRTEVMLLANCEPVLAGFLYTTLLKHKSLSSVLSCIIANKLANSLIPAIVIRDVIDEVYEEDPNIIWFAVRDIYAMRYRDPTVDKYSTPLLYFKGFHALQAYRIGHWLWYKNRQALAIYFQNQISVSFGVDIHPAAHIGSGIMLDHATGIVIGETSIVENDVSILQSVTLGGTGKISGDRHPKIRKGVMIGAGATILGNIEIGYRAKVGAGSVVLHSVSCYTTVAGIPATVVGRSYNI